MNKNSHREIYFDTNEIRNNVLCSRFKVLMPLQFRPKLYRKGSKLRNQTQVLHQTITNGLPSTNRLKNILKNVWTFISTSKLNIKSKNWSLFPRGREQIKKDIKPYKSSLNLPNYTLGRCLCKKYLTLCIKYITLNQIYYTF